jgi:hypothetical protein
MLVMMIAYAISWRGRFCGTLWLTQNQLAEDQSD